MMGMMGIWVEGIRRWRGRLSDLYGLVFMMEGVRRIRSAMFCICGGRVLHLTTVEGCTQHEQPIGNEMKTKSGARRSASGFQQVS